ncbi:alpha-E domain-containing protein, partial [Undibacterium luofuense]
MLSRTADHLFWMARYTERAENTARMLDVNIQTSMLPQSAQDAEQGWRAMLGISELQEAFDHHYGLLSKRDVLDFMVRD